MNLPSFSFPWYLWKLLLRHTERGFCQQPSWQMSSDPLWKHFSPNTAVTFPLLLRQKIRQNIILINFCLTDQSATDSHPLGTLACTDTLLTESGALGFKLLSRRISGLPGGAGGILRSRPRSPALPGAAACSYP